jgi:hypothetical protein
MVHSCVYAEVEPMWRWLLLMQRRPNRPPLPMQRPLSSPLCFQRVKQSLLEKILRRCGAYYQSGDLFYQQLWHQHLSRIGFRVISVEKLPYHELWDIRLFGSLTAQSYLLLTKPVAKPHLWAKDLLLKQLHLEVQQAAKDFGAPMRRDCIHVARKGAYVRVTFIWPLGKPGRWVKPEKKAEAFSFLIRPWLRRSCN